jgi:hypothetical protein
VARVAYGQVNARDLQVFVREKNVGAVLVEDGQRASWAGALQSLAPPQHVDGMLVYRVDRDAASC